MNAMDNNKGSVMLEFILVLPIYLLLIGGTMLTYELLSAKLHLQLVNRNLAWSVGDRYFDRSAKEDFKKVLFGQLCEYFSSRNRMENLIKENEEPFYKMPGNQEFWGIGVDRKQAGDSFFQGANVWGNLVAGNMPLKMNRVSGAYIGAVGLSSVMYPDKSGTESTPMYKASYDLTRTKPITDESEVGNEEFSPESYLYRRFDWDVLRRDESKDLEEDSSYLKNVFQVVSENWPSFQDTEFDASQSLELPTGRYVRSLWNFAQ